MQGNTIQKRLRSRKSSNGWLYIEMVNNLAREQSLNKVAQTVNSSLDLPTVLKTITRLSTELLRADASMLGLLTSDGQHLTFPYFFNLPIAREEPLPRERNLSWHVIDTCEPILIHNYAEHPFAHTDLVQLGVRECVGVPVTAGDSCLGIMVVFNISSHSHFNRSDLALAESVGRQVGVAIQNAQNYRATLRRAEESETLRKAVWAVRTDLNLEQMFDRILTNLGKVIHYDSAALFLVEGDHLRIVAGHGFPEADKIIGRTYYAGNPLFEETIATLSPVILGDAANDVRFESWSNQEVRSWMGIPMQLRGRTIGFLTVDSHQPNTYSHIHATLAQAFANEATVALENARLFQEAQLLAITDPLTGISNRRHFLHRGKIEVERAAMNNHPLSAIMLDLDNFKRVNDTYGHAVGDQVLREIAQCCRKRLREADIFGRVGGEEFIALLPGIDLEQAEWVARRLHDAILAYLLETPTGRIYVSASFGVTELKPGCNDLDKLLLDVDHALYASKRNGKDKISVKKEGELL
jgi:diguanylate cyclase (GGDEF)-like protein